MGELYSAFNDAKSGSEDEEEAYDMMPMGGGGGGGAMMGMSAQPQMNMMSAPSQPKSKSFMPSSSKIKGSRKLDDRTSTMCYQV